MPTDEQWLTQPGEAATMIADARARAIFQPHEDAIRGMVASNAQTMRMVAAERFKEVFAKWGPEVDSLMANVAPELRTLDNYEKVVKYVRGNHMEEIATERARQLIAQGGSLGERSGGSHGLPGAPAAGLDYDKLPAGVGELAKQKGLTESMVVDWCKKNGWTVERWMTESQNGKVFTSTSPFTQEMRDDQLGIKRQYGE